MRDRFGRFARPPLTAPLLFRKAKSKPHIAGHVTRKAKRAAWVKAHIEQIRGTM